MRIPVVERQTGVPGVPSPRYQPAEAVGAGEQMLGRALEQVGQIIVERAKEIKSRRDKTKVMEITTTYYKRRQDYLYGENGVMKRRGKAADGSYKKAIEDLEAMRDEFLAIAENDDQRFMLQSLLDEDIQRQIEIISRHEVAESEKWQEENYELAIEQLTSDAALAAGDLTQFNLTLQQIQQLTIARYNLDLNNPQDAASLEQRMKIMRAKLHSITVAALIDKDPYAALAWIDQYEAEMEGTKAAAFRREAQNRIDADIRDSAPEMEDALVPVLMETFGKRTEEAEKAIHEGKLPDGTPLLWRGRGLTAWQKDYLVSAYRSKLTAKTAEEKNQEALDIARKFIYGENGQGSHSWRDRETAKKELFEKYGDDADMWPRIEAAVENLWQIEREADIQSFVNDNAQRIAKNYTYLRRDEAYAEIRRLQTLPENAHRKDAEWTELRRAVEQELDLQEQQATEIQGAVYKEVYNLIPIWHQSPDRSKNYQNMVKLINGLTFTDPVTGQVLPLDQSFKDALLNRAAAEWGVGSKAPTPEQESLYRDLYLKFNLIENGRPAILNECRTVNEFIKKYGGKLTDSDREYFTKLYIKLATGQQGWQQAPGYEPIVDLSPAAVITGVLDRAGVKDKVEQAQVIRWINIIGPAVEQKLGRKMNDLELENLVWQGLQTQVLKKGGLLGIGGQKEELYDIMNLPGVVAKWDPRNLTYTFILKDGTMLKWTLDLNLLEATSVRR